MKLTFSEARKRREMLVEKIPMAILLFASVFLLTVIIQVMG